MKTARHLIAGLIAGLFSIAPSLAQETVKIGMLVPMTGPFTPTGKQPRRRPALHAAKWRHRRRQEN